MPTCISPDESADFAARDVNRIVGKIAEVLAYKSPYIDILDGGILPNVSTVVRSVVAEQAVPVSSLAAPVFTNDEDMCGVVPDADQVGSTEYSYRLQTLRGIGPKVCVKTTRTAFKDSYLRAQQSMEKAILKIMNADVRNTLLMRSGVKFVAKTGNSFATNFTGDSQNIDVQFAPFLPDAPVSFKMFWRLMATLREELLVEPFEGESGAYFKWIGSIDSIEVLRNELDIKEDLRAYVKGKYQWGADNLNSYQFMGPYRGLALGVDQQPLRSNGFDGNGDLILIEPEIAVAATNGVAARRNPAWISALYEVGFMVGGNSFKKLSPEKYNGEGTMKYAPQLSMGELEWYYNRDSCNVFGDFGMHIYQISRAYQPIRPHAVIPVLYKRCDFDLGLNTCSSSQSGL